MLNRTIALSLAGVALSAGAVLLATYDPALDCSGGGRLCPSVPEAEIGQKKLSIYDGLRRAVNGGSVHPSALRAAYEQKQALQSAKASVPGADGRWEQYGKTSLVSSGLAQTLGADLGFAEVPDINVNRWAGRVDNFAYDPVAKRLFAAPGTSGIWMSEARNGDVRTLGDYWVSIGDNLPTQANGAVIWTAGGGGTVISASGDSVMSTGAYPGLGAFWSNDLGTTWNRADGFPDGVQVFNASHDPGNPNIVYIASSRGLYRSQDAGRSFRNVRLPVVSNGVDCASFETIDPATACNLATVVSDVVVKAPGGTSNVQCSSRGCPVLAAIGWRAGQLFYPDTEIPQSPANGLYRSETGEPGTFVKLDLPAVDSTTEMGFAPPQSIGRIEMAVAEGPFQDHNYVYAMVQDAELLNGTKGVTLDAPLDVLGDLPVGQTLVNGLYVSADFGSSWTRMADAAELGTIPGPFAALVPPGVQSWYNQWIAVDPTRSAGVDDVVGIPTRIAFGLEEVFTNLLPVPLNGTLQAGPQDFQNVGYYFSAVGADQTPHPDQHAGIIIPIADPLLGDLGVCLFAGHDGGVSRQCVPAGAPFDNRLWGVATNEGFHTLLPYGLAVAKDGTVWFGLQDNGSGHIEPDTRESFGDFGADGFYAEVDPDNSDIAYTESQNGGLRRTTDRGGTATAIDPPYTRVNFANWFSMDPLDANHMITLANEVYETLDAPNVTSSTWDLVYTLGLNEETGVVFTATVGDVHGSAIYVGACGDCGVTANDTKFQNRIATNVGGKEPPQSGTEDGWHDATAKGLPNRLITAIEIDPNDPKTVYVGLGGYSSPLRDVGAFGEDSTGADPDAGNIFKSTDAGETFVSIQGDLPKMPVTTILVREGQLVIGGDFGAFISSDTKGTAWAPLGSGLPNVPVTQMKLQPGNPNKLFASTFGRHVWTYEFTGEAAVKLESKQGRGLLIGALPVGLLSMLVLSALLRYRRRLVVIKKPII